MTTNDIENLKDEIRRLKDRINTLEYLLKGARRNAQVKYKYKLEEIINKE